MPYTTNRGLFSDHYLTTRLSELPEWHADHDAAYRELSALLSQKAGALPTLNEAQTEQQFIRPALDVLGWSYETQITFRALERDYRPDYGLFLSEQQQRAARATVSSREEPCGRPYLDRVAALGEAKYWERPLEERRADDRRDPAGDRGRSPHFQIIDYLRDSGVRWGILTNGRTWRLYLTAAASSEILYYEADLQGILESGDPDVFKRFYLFFGAGAFAPDEHGRCFVDRLREESQRYATQVEDSLKERVFDSVVPVIAGGFLHHLREHRGTEVSAGDRDTLDRIYSGTLLLLYRLFFLLFAEARGLIAVGDGAGYAARSLGHLKDEIYRAMRDGVALGTTSTDWWDDLRNLFRIVNIGDSGLNVPRYNGGLFAPDGLGDPDIQPAAEFLEQNAIADKHIAEAVMLLTHHAEPGGAYTRPEFIDFRDLGVRHLGSIYEGLLEFKLNIAEDALVQATDRGKPVWKPAPDPASADRQSGDIYLTNDKRERKATGSYYTPDYIVRYIVESTIGPQIDHVEREHYLAQSIRAGEDARPPWAELLGEVLQGKPLEESRAARELWAGLRSDAERRQFLLNQLDGVQPEHAYDPPTRMLELKVLDPALGSGHFLVGALDYMTTRLAAMLNKYAESPVFERIRVDRTKIVESLRHQGIEADPAKLTDENLLRRTVMKRCLYGVDLNPLAVELSKLSLWLHAFTAGAPLSFLDHHIKCGNSLIGSTLEDLRREARKAGGLWSLPMEPLERAVQHMLTVAELSDASFEDVERSREEYWAADARVEGYRAMLDSLTAEHFGVKHASHFVQYGRDLDLDNFGDSLAQLSDEDRERLEQARNVARGIRFFHWEVEFPEVFFERRGQGVEEKADAGFDAVVGNPPWGVTPSGDSRRYLRTRYNASASTLDSFALFVEQSLGLLAQQERLGYIVPSGWQTGKSYVSFRKMLLSRSALRRMVNLPYDVFPEAYVDATVAVVERVRPTDLSSVEALGTVRILSFRRHETVTQIDDTDGRFHTIQYATWFSQEMDPHGEFALLSFLGPEELKVAQKVAAPAIAFGQVADIQRGITPFQLLAGKPDETYFPALDGEQRRYYYSFSGGAYVKYSPSIAEYKPPKYFQGPRLILREMISRQFQLQAVLVDEDFVTNKSHQSVLPRNCDYALGYLLGVLNSRLLSHHHVQSSSIALRDDFPKIVLDETRNLPVRRILFITPRKVREERRSRLTAAYQADVPSFEAILRDVTGLLPRTAECDLTAFADSVSMADALRRHYVEAVPDYLGEDAPSGFDSNGNPLEHSDVVHDFLAHLAEQMMAMHKESQTLWDSVRGAFLNKGVNPDDLSSVSVTKSILDSVSKARQAKPSAKQRRTKTYAEQAEQAFGCPLGRLYEIQEASYGFEDLPRLGYDRFKWLAALRGADPALLDDAWDAAKDNVAALEDVLERIGSGPWYPRRDPATGAYDVDNIRSTDWLIDQIVYRLYGLSEEEVRVVEGFGPDSSSG